MIKILCIRCAAVCFFSGFFSAFMVGFFFGEMSYGCCLIIYSKKDI